MNEERVDPPIDRYARVSRERVAWSIATYSTRRAIGLRDAREELWIETVFACSGRATVARIGRGIPLPVDSRGETLWIAPRARERQNVE